MPGWAKRHELAYALSIPHESIVFGQVSSLIHRKGLDVLLRAFQLLQERHPGARLVLVGDGPQREEYCALANELGIADKVVFAGDQSNPVPLYQHVFDVNVLASRSDAFPLSVLEAAACGLPNIGASVDGISEAVRDGRAGFLFDRCDHRMLMEKMSLLVEDRNLLKCFGEANGQLAITEFSSDEYCHTVQSTILSQLQRVSIDANRQV